MADHEEIEEVDEERQEEKLDKSGDGGEKRKHFRREDRYIAIVQLKDIQTWTNYYRHNDYKFSKIQKTLKIGKPPHKVNTEINDKVSLYVGDITKLEIDAIVNAANKTLLGGGGVDGCIHRAAGKALKEECRLLDGCKTGEAKITSGHKLPAKHVIHTVGPVGENEKALKSCYKNCLNVAVENDVRTLAFCCISTGIYGYPNKDAAEVALRTTRKWLEKQSNADKIDRIIFCLFLEKDIEIYESLMLKYFPPGERERTNESPKEKTRTLPQTDEHNEPKAEKTPEDEDNDKEKQNEDVKEEEQQQKSPEDSEKLDDGELETRESEKPNSKKEESSPKTEKRDEDTEKRLKEKKEYQEELKMGTNDDEKEGSDVPVVPKPPKKPKQESESNENDEQNVQDVEMINEDSQQQEIKKEEKVAQEEVKKMEGVEDALENQDKEDEDVVMGSNENQAEETEVSSEKQQDSEKPPKETCV